MTRRLLAAAVTVLALAGLSGAAGPPPVPPTRWVSQPAPPVVEDDPEVTLAFAGDVNFAGRNGALLDDPATAFGPVARVLSAADVTMLNLETAVTERGRPEPKQYHFRTSPAAFDAMRAAGVDVVSLANNHTLDYGRTGLVDTILAAADARFPAIGAGLDADRAYQPWITTVRGVRVAFLALSQIRELSATWAAHDDRSGIAMAFDVARSVAAVRAARARADAVIVFLHWGEQGNPCPVNRQRTLAGQLAAAGATAVIGAHAHVLQGDGWLGRTYVAYGLGNFLWYVNRPESDDTGVLRVRLRRGAVVGTELVPARISTRTGQPIPSTGPERDRIARKFSALRECTRLGPQA